ncbi:MAG: cytidine deaminase [Saprospiraceae bacterium]|nr:cytidine deaminase [Saprospiraceae bacterium]MDW8229317.1 cytidine deaminase [Saprospiraceae bacterium]
MRRTYQIVFSEYAGTEALPPDDRQLLAAAVNALEKSYAPYSGFRVGAAARLSNGAVVSGANFENVAYPMCLCAERSTVAAALSQYPEARITTLAVTAASTKHPVTSPAMPCGACRQVLFEVEQKYGQPLRLILQGQAGPIWVFERVSDLLPLAFGPEMLRFV